MPKTSKRDRGTPAMKSGMIINVPRAIRSADQTTSEVIRRLTAPAATLTLNSGFSITSSSVTSATEWANLSARYTEARVLGIKMFILPITGNAAVILSTDRSGALAAPANATVAWSFAGARLVYLGATSRGLLTYSAQAKDLEDFNFDAVGSMTSRFSIVGFNTSGTASSYWLEYVVEFRGNR